jgi:glucokinase
MGPGTGLGQANLYWSMNFGSYRVWPSEGSHSSFAPRGWKQRALQTHVERQLGYCEVEHVSTVLSTVHIVHCAVVYTLLMTRSLQRVRQNQGAYACMHLAP